MFCAAWGGGSAWQGEPNLRTPHEAHLLQLAVDKANLRLDWHPRWDFETRVKRTALGYRRLLAASDAAEVRQFMQCEIEAYGTATSSRWARSGARAAGQDATPEHVDFGRANVARRKNGNEQKQDRQPRSKRALHVQSAGNHDGNAGGES